MPEITCMDHRYYPWAPLYAYNAAGGVADVGAGELLKVKKLGHKGKWAVDYIRRSGSRRSKLIFAECFPDAANQAVAFYRDELYTACKWD